MTEDDQQERARIRGERFAQALGKAPSRLQLAIRQLESGFSMAYVALQCGEPLDNAPRAIAWQMIKDGREPGRIAELTGIEIERVREGAAKWAARSANKPTSEE